MKIGILESNIYPVPPPLDVISAPLDLVNALISELSARSVDVTLFAANDSKISTKLVSYDLPSLYSLYKGFHINTAREAELANTFENTLTSLAYEYAQDNHFDLMHSHPLGSTLFFSHLANLPTLFTLHVPLQSLIFGKKLVPTRLDYQILALHHFGTNPHNYFVSISNAQRRTAQSLNYVATIYHGVNIKEYSFSPKGGGTLGILGRIVEEKGFHLAIQIAKKNCVQLNIAGQPSTSRPDYWNKHVKPFIDQKLIIYKGMIKGNAKVNFLKASRALIFPIQWEEPFGLVMVEAMACGTPVIAFGRGSVPEVVKDGETGFICPPGDMKCMVQAVKRIYDMPEDKYRAMRRACRAHVEKNFTVEKMVDRYERVYEQVIRDWKRKNGKKK